MKTYVLVMIVKARSSLGSNKTAELPFVLWDFLNWVYERVMVVEVKGRQQWTEFGNY